MREKAIRELNEFLEGNFSWRSNRMINIFTIQTMQKLRKHSRRFSAITEHAALKFCGKNSKSRRYARQ